MPDIDTDFCIERRTMIKYVTQKYGKDRVAQIITFNRLTSKAVLKDVARVLNISYGEADHVVNSCRARKPTKLAVMIISYYQHQSLKKIRKGSSVRHWIDMALQLRDKQNLWCACRWSGNFIWAARWNCTAKNNDGSVITVFHGRLGINGAVKNFLGLRNLTLMRDSWFN